MILCRAQGVQCSILTTLYLIVIITQYNVYRLPEERYHLEDVLQCLLCPESLVGQHVLLI